MPPLWRNFKKWGFNLKGDNQIMNANLLERQLIEARIHADALSHTVQQLEALKTSLQSEEINRIVVEMTTPLILREDLLREEIRPLCTSLEEISMQLQEIADLIGYSIIVPLVEEGFEEE